MKFLNLNMPDRLTGVKGFAIGSKNYVTDSIRSCSSTIYNYGCNRLQANWTRVKSSIDPYIPHLKRSAEVIEALIIGGVALQVLKSVSSRLPIGVIPASFVAAYALRHPNQSAQFIALYTIGSVVGKTSALSSYSLSVIQAFALYVSADTAVKYMSKKVAKTEEVFTV